MAPNEEFTCSLGMDGAVRVVYQPLNRYRDQQGLFQKSNVQRFQQTVEITNTKAVPVKV